MESKEIRRKISSVNNIWKLTSALETLSALKMKKAQKLALASQPFAKKIAEILEKIEPVLEGQKSIFAQGRKVEKILFVVITSDRGFCGSFNQNILRLAEKKIAEVEKESQISFFPVGKKSKNFGEKKNLKIEASFFGIGDWVELEEAKPVSDFLIKAFGENKFQKVYLIFTNFISTFSLKPKMIQLLPLTREAIKEFLGESADPAEKETEFLVEPSLQVLTDEIIPQLVEYLIYHAILESNAAEHSSRMLAMKNASENAKQKSVELMFDYNKARQEQITSEVSEISSTKEVLE